MTGSPSTAGPAIEAMTPQNIIRWRRQSREALARLKGMGIKVMMLTGDATAVASWVAREVALD